MKIKIGCHTVLVLATCVLHSTASFSQGQQQGQQTRRTSFERPADTRSNSRQQVTFSKHATKIGDQSNQLLVVKTDLNSIVRMGKTELEKSRVLDLRRLQRDVTATDVKQNRMIAARVKYITSENETEINEEPSEIKKEIVVGKTYQCRREGDKLLVTDAEGHMPSMKEYEIVAQGMDSLGKPNPIADFLNGKTIEIGQTVAMPHNLAQQLLGLGESIDTVHRFDLTLTQIEKPSSGAVFRAILDASSHQEGQMRMQLEGTMIIESNGCRLTVADLQGPIGIAKSVVRAGSAMHFTSTGQLGVTITAEYNDAR